MDIASIMNPKSPPRPHRAQPGVIAFPPLRTPDPSEDSIESILERMASAHELIEQGYFERFDHHRGRQSSSQRVTSSGTHAVRAAVCQADRLEHNFLDPMAQSEKDFRCSDISSESTIDEIDGNDFHAASAMQSAEYKCFQTPSLNLSSMDIECRPQGASIDADMSALRDRNDSKDSLGYYARRTSMMLERGSYEQNQLTFGSEAVVEQYGDMHKDPDRRKSLGTLTDEPTLPLLPGFSSKLQHPVIERLKVNHSLNWDNEDWESPLSSEVSPALDPYGSSDLLIQFRSPSYDLPTLHTESTHKKPEPVTILQGTPASQEMPHPKEVLIQHRHVKHVDALFPDAGLGCGPCCYPPRQMPKAIQSKRRPPPERSHRRPIYTREGGIYVPQNYFLEFLDPGRFGRKFEGTQGDLEDMMRWDNDRFAEEIVYTTEASEPFLPRKRDNGVIISVKEIDPSHSSEDEPNPKCSHCGRSFNDQSTSHGNGSSEPIDEKATQMETPTKDNEKSIKLNLEYSSEEDELNNEIIIPSISGPSKVDIDTVIQTESPKHDEKALEFGLDDDITRPDNETIPEFLHRFPNKFTISATHEPRTPNKGNDNVGSPNSSPLRSKASVRFELPREASTPSRNTSTECVRGTPDNSHLRGGSKSSSPVWSSLRKKTSSIFLTGSTNNSPSSDHPSPGSKKNSPTRSDNGSPSTSSAHRSLRKMLSGSLRRGFKRPSVIDFAAKNPEEVEQDLDEDAELEKDPFNTKFEEIEYA